MLFRFHKMLETVHSILCCSFLWLLSRIRSLLIPFPVPAGQGTGTGAGSLSRLRPVTTASTGIIHIQEGFFNRFAAAEAFSFPSVPRISWLPPRPRAGESQVRGRQPLRPGPAFPPQRRPSVVRRACPDRRSASQRGLFPRIRIAFSGKHWYNKMFASKYAKRRNLP